MPDVYEDGFPLPQWLVRLIQTMKGKGKALLASAFDVVKPGGGQIEKDNPGFSNSGRPWAAGKPFQKVGRVAPPPF